MRGKKGSSAEKRRQQPAVIRRGWGEGKGLISTDQPICFLLFNRKKRGRFVWENGYLCEERTKICNEIWWKGSEGRRGRWRVKVHSVYMPCQIRYKRPASAQRAENRCDFYNPRGLINYSHISHIVRDYVKKYTNEDCKKKKCTVKHKYKYRPEAVKEGAV